MRTHKAGQGFGKQTATMSTEHVSGLKTRSTHEISHLLDKYNTAMAANNISSLSQKEFFATVITGFLS
jgi:hypothetical protein